MSKTLDITGEHITIRRTTTEKVSIELDDNEVELLIREALISRNLIGNDTTIDFDWDVREFLRGVTIRYEKTKEDVV